jgi:hypothetical protein
MMGLQSLSVQRDILERLIGKNDDSPAVCAPSPPFGGPCRAWAFCPRGSHEYQAAKAIRNAIADADFVGLRLNRL